MRILFEVLSLLCPRRPGVLNWEDPVIIMAQAGGDRDSVTGIICFYLSRLVHLRLDIRSDPWCPLLGAFLDFRWVLTAWRIKGGFHARQESILGAHAQKESLVGGFRCLGVHQSDLSARPDCGWSGPGSRLPRYSWRVAFKLVVNDVTEALVSPSSPQLPSQHLTVIIWTGTWEQSSRTSSPWWGTEAGGSSEFFSSPGWRES